MLNPGMVRDLLGTVQSQRAEMGLLITLDRPTRGMEEAARHSGTFTWPVNRQPYPMVQLLTVSDLLSGQRPKMPTPFLPYIQAKRSLRQPSNSRWDSGRGRLQRAVRSRLGR